MHAIAHTSRALLVSCGLVLACSGKSDGCLSGDEPGCLPKSPCPALSFECANPELAVRVLESALDRPFGLKADAGRGDVLLENGRIRAVLSGIGSPRGLSPSGGSIIDLVPRTESAEDALNQVFQAVGILPDDAAHYREVELLDERPRSVAAVFRGTLDLRPEIRIVTRYELQACDPGLRIRTELFSAAREPLAIFPSDAAFWGDRNLTPFVPLPGQGYVHPALELDELDAAFRDSQFLAADAHDRASSSYGLMSCEDRGSSGFHSATISALGVPRRLLEPFDGLGFERFLLVQSGPGLSRAVDDLLTAREQLFGEQISAVTGKVRDASQDPLPFAEGERRLSLLFFDADSQTPMSEVVPSAQGEFSLSLPRGRRFRIEPFVLGRASGPSLEFETDSESVVLPEIASPTPARLVVHVSDSSGAPIISEVILVPAPPTLPSQVGGSVFGVFNEGRCAPYLGPPHGATPACNRVLLDAKGQASFWVPPGSYFVYATRGPFWSLARRRVQMGPGEQQVLQFSLRHLDLLPSGVLSADLHVHGGASFDSNLPERDRVLSFVAQGVDVVAATDHDVVTDYQRTVTELGLHDLVRVMPGVETTGQILFLRPPGSEVPRVVGHFNFWPLRRDPDLPRNGAPDDERLEPAALMERVEPLTKGVFVAQLNHPYAAAELGRDHGYLSAVRYDPRRRVPAEPDETTEGQLRRRTPSGRDNLDFHAQEVMNGTSLEGFLRNRTGWFSFLNQGILRSGTANSDSHTLAIEVLGYPRNLVFGQPPLSGFEPDTFNWAVRRAELVGTNGPVLEVCLELPELGCLGPSLSLRQPAADSVLSIRVAAAPFVPVSEVRVIVNGTQVKAVPLSPALPADPFGVEGLERYRGTFLLSELVTPGTDAWLVVEAGLPLPLAADFEDDDGLLDTTDNDGNGLVDARDGVGDFREPGRNEPGVAEQSNVRFHVQALAPGVWPTAFSNPIILDWNGDGFEAPGL